MKSIESQIGKRIIRIIGMKNKRRREKEWMAIKTDTRSLIRSTILNYKRKNEGVV